MLKSLLPSCAAAKQERLIFTGSLSHSLTSVLGGKCLTACTKHAFIANVMLFVADRVQTLHQACNQTYGLLAYGLLVPYTRDIAFCMHRLVHYISQQPGGLPGLTSCGVQGAKKFQQD